MLANYNFIYYELNTFQPYIDETSFEDSLNPICSNADNLTRLKFVMVAMTPNAQKVFEVLASYHYRYSLQSDYEGYNFEALAKLCREKFICTSSTVLRANLKEFSEHKITKMKTTANGSESVWVLTPRETLKQYLDES